MNTPDFLVIGAQKSGTTTLHADLAEHPQITMTYDKESAVLTKPALSSDPNTWYRAQFPKEHDDAQLYGEVSTTYSMRDTFPLALSRAKALGKELKIIYIVRNPILRTISHHHHDYSLGLCGSDIDLELTRRRALVEHSKYWHQLSPWVAQHGENNCLVIRFEDYTQERQFQFDKLCRFLGVGNHALSSPLAVHNSAQDKVVSTRRWSKVINSEIYRRWIRPLLPHSVIDSVKNKVLPPAPPRPSPPTERSLSFLQASFSEDLEGLRSFTSGNVSWDIQATLDKLLSS